MKKKYLLCILSMLCFFIVLVSIVIGTVYISPLEILSILTEKYFNVVLIEDIEEITKSIVLNIRLPRVLLAFLGGSGLAVSGMLMQSVLRNPLASSLTLGISSGASLGASFVILFNFSMFGFLTLPIFGLTSGLVTVFLALGIASKIDKNFENTSIILTGTAFSLFANAMITIIMALAREGLQNLVYWQMGSFAMRDNKYILILLPFVLFGVLITLRFSKEIDILTLGDEQAKTTGIDAKNMKLLLISISGIITGSIISVVGIIGFVDLFTPHVARKIFGSSHKYLVLGSALLGGFFMVACDLIARTIIPPLEIPVGAITAILGAPFFIYLFIL